jgi:hypothetical protein
MIPTPRERAQELIDYYYQFQEIDAEYCMIQNSKLCARRVVEEVLGVIAHGPVIQYWLEVRDEIEAITYVENPIKRSEISRQDWISHKD